MSKDKEKKTTQEKTVEHEFKVVDLIENCEKITSHKKEVAEGALYDYEKERITKSDFKKKVESFLKKEVK